MSLIFWNKIGNFLVGAWQFFAGILITAFFYYRQKNDDGQGQRNLISVWEKLLDQKGSALANKIDTKLDKLIKNSDKIKTLDEEYQKVNLNLKNALEHNNKDLYFETALEYKKVAELRAKYASEEQEFDLLNNKGSLTLEAIKRVHTAIFPRGYVWAGKFRQYTVVISGKYNAGSRSIESNLSSYQATLLDPDKVEYEIKKLIKRWNGTVNQLINTDNSDIARELAEFHHTFLFIHPFLDGNGRIARVILNEQASFLENKNIKFKFEREIYYKALHLADQGKSEDLISLIHSQLS